MDEPTKVGTSRRKSLTKQQRATATGVELIALCQTITADAHLVDEEIVGLGHWLVENRGSDLPAIAFLTQTVERVLADGIVTADERLELYLAIETVLPPDIRGSVRGARLSGKRLVRDLERSEKETTKQLLVLERERDAPVESWDFMVAGVGHDGRDDVVGKFAAPNAIVYLVRDRSNAFSGNATEVRLSNGMQVGYVPEIHAVEIAPLLDSGHRHDARIKKIVKGSRLQIPVVVADLYRSDVGEDIAVAESDLPAAVTMRRASPSGVPTRVTAPSRRWWHFWR